MSNNAPGLSEQAKNDGYAALIDIIARLKEESKKEDFQEACDNAPIEPKGRTLLQIVLDDIMANFVTLMQHQPDDKIPKDFYKIMLGTREDREIGDAELDQRLAEALAEKRKPENSRDIKEPEVLKVLEVLKRSAAFGTISGCEKLLLNINSHIARLGIPEETLKTERELNHLANAIMMGFSDLEAKRTLPATIPVKGPEKGPQDILVEKIESPDLKALLAKFSVNISSTAQNLPGNHGRDAEAKDLARIMLQKEGSAALLQGEHGVGKTVIVEALAKNIADGKGPKRLANAQIHSISLKDLLFKQGPQGLGEITHAIVSNTIKHNRENPENPVILHFPDYGAHFTPLQEFRAYLGHAAEKHPELMLICEADPRELAIITQNQPDAIAPLQDIRVEELSAAATFRKAKAEATSLVAHHDVTVPDDAINYLIRKTDSFISGYRPGKTLETLRASMAEAELSGKNSLSIESIDSVIANKTGLPLALIGGEISERIDNLKENLNQRIFGQEEAIEAISGQLSLVNYGMHDPEKPLGVFYFTGTTGVGKTAIAEALGDCLSEGAENSLITVNLADFAAAHTVSRIVGSPPGYVGYGGKTALEDVKKRPYSVILLDEAEKAHPEIDNALLRIMDKGQLVLLDGQTIDFRNTVLIFTSNLGASAAEAAEAKRTIGFHADTYTGEERRAEAREAEAKLRLKPEFRNRATIINLNNLTAPVVRKIALKQIDTVSERLRDNQLYAGLSSISLSESAIDELMSLGFDAKNGARPMKRAIETHLQVPLGKWLKENSSKVLNKQFSLAINGLKDKLDIEIKYPDTPRMQPA